jgi:acetyl-CoA carboxylase biotin carboxyl carrier protein
MDLEFVRGLIEAVDESGIDSLEITRAGTRVKISKTPPSVGPAPTYVAAPQAQPAPAPAASQPTAPVQPEAPSAPSEEGEAAEAAPESDGLVEITSPMVGTFYRAPAPDAPPYVEVGTSVSKGQTLCILEAMKLMNELEAEVGGEIREILVENAEPVEYGQVLFRVAPNG